MLLKKKELVWFENSAHFPQWEERAQFHEFLLKTVLPATAV
jgi:pimeloyl-ACP methyl ester carboxylesterase